MPIGLRLIIPAGKTKTTRPFSIRLNKLSWNAVLSALNISVPMEKKLSVQFIRFAFCLNPRRGTLKVCVPTKMIIGFFD